MSFRPEQVTEGNIAIDDNVTTPVSSQYSGRVIKLLAKLGDRVEAGAPLFEIQTTEFAQAQDTVWLIACIAARSSPPSRMSPMRCTPCNRMPTP